MKQGQTGVEVELGGVGRPQQLLIGGAFIGRLEEKRVAATGGATWRDGGGGGGAAADLLGLLLPALRFGRPLFDVGAHFFVLFNYQ